MEIFSKMGKNGANGSLERFKKMCRLLEISSREFFSNDWQRYSDLLTPQQYNHLMLVRLALPCNLTRIMALTGLTSAGASLFADKMVKLGIFTRVENPTDRRNVIIDFTPQAKVAVERTEERLNESITGFFDTCTEEEISIINLASSLVCIKLASLDK